MRRVVVTGIGIVSSIGNDRWEVLESLRQGRSGLEFAENYKEMGLRSHVCGPLRVDLAALIDRKVLRFMGDALVGQLAPQRRSRLLFIACVQSLVRLGVPFGRAKLSFAQLPFNLAFLHDLQRRRRPEPAPTLALSRRANRLPPPADQALPSAGRPR